MTQTISIGKIIENSNNPRGDISNASVETLAKNIDKVGLVNPLTVVADKKKKGFFNLIAGHRRLVALRSLKKNEVVIHEVDSKTGDCIAEISLAENSPDTRSNLEPLKEGKVLKGLLKKYETVAHLSVITGVRENRCRQLLTILKAPIALKECIEKGLKISCALEFRKEKEWYAKDIIHTVFDELGTDYKDISVRETKKAIKSVILDLAEDDATDEDTGEVDDEKIADEVLDEEYIPFTHSEVESAIVEQVALVVEGKHDFKCEMSDPSFRIGVACGLSMSQGLLGDTIELPEDAITKQRIMLNVGYFYIYSYLLSKGIDIDSEERYSVRCLEVLKMNTSMDTKVKALLSEFKRPKKEADTPKKKKKK